MWVREELGEWWQALLDPRRAMAMIEVSGCQGRRTTRFLLVLVLAGYGAYGLGMGWFRGWIPGLVSAVKFPLLFLGALGVCFVFFYLLNCLTGVGYSCSQCVRLLLMASSANAAALCSFAPLAVFFTLTTSRSGYLFLVAMHVAAVGLAAAISFSFIVSVFRSAVRARRKATVFGGFAVWCVLYTLVGGRLVWALRPWVGSWAGPYAPLRDLRGSFWDSVFQLVQNTWEALQ